MGILSSCQPRPEVLRGEMTDAIFAADFGDLVNREAPRVYQEAANFFDNTYPTAELKRIASVVFDRLADPTEGGGLLRLSTGFGGGKTHTLMTLWHLAGNTGNSPLGQELLPQAKRLSQIRVVGIDASKGGLPIFAMHGAHRVKSFAGEVVYQLGGVRALEQLGDADHPNASPNEEQLKAAFPEGPVLILLDELVVYMAKLSEQGQGNLLGFIGSLASVVAKRPRTVLVVTDPAAQHSYDTESLALNHALKLAGILGRKFSDFDPVGDESARIIARRLFASIDPAAAERTAADYLSLYQRVRSEQPDLIPPAAVVPKYADELRTSYPFHPRLMITARDRLGALEGFQKSRGVLRLFARIIRNVWECNEDCDLITAGEVDFSDTRIRADLLDRLNRDSFAAAVSADVETHAAELDGEDTARGIHTRVASAILLESLPMQDDSSLTPDQLTLATLRLDEAGPEAIEAASRLEGVCWHLYPLSGTGGWRFRYEPNILKQIEERMSDIPHEDARSRVLTEVQAYFRGMSFKVANWPSAPHDVPDSADLQLALCDDIDLGLRIVRFADDRDPERKMPRRFINAIIALAPTPPALADAVDRARRLLALENIETEIAGSPNRDSRVLVSEQVKRLKPDLGKRFRIQSLRTFDQLILPGGRIVRLPEQYLGTDEEILKKTQGQHSVLRYLEDHELIFVPGAALDLDLLMNKILSGTVTEDDGVWTARAIQERILALPELRLISGPDLLRQTLRKAVSNGRLVLRAPDGAAYDREGAVLMSKNRRQRKKGQLPPPELPLDERTRVALPASVAALDWLKETPGVGEAPAGGGPIPPPPSEPAASSSTLRVVQRDRLSVQAEKSPLLKLDLRASSIAAAEQLASLASPLGAITLTQTVFLSGASRTGGELRFDADGLLINDPVHPLDVVKRLYNALPAENRKLEVTLNLDFGPGGREKLAAQLQYLAEAASDEIEITAEFGAEPRGEA